MLKWRGKEGPDTKAIDAGESSFSRPALANFVARCHYYFYGSFHSDTFHLKLSNRLPSFNSDFCRTRTNNPRFLFTASRLNMRPKPDIFSHLCSCYSDLVISDDSQQDEGIHNEIREHCSDMILSDEQLKQVKCKLNSAINQGLGKKTHKDAIVKCFVTYVQDLPTGKETGKFLALDLGGTNFRVLLVTLAPGDFDMKSKIYAVPDSIMKGPGDKLFDHIAECLSDFVTEQGVKDVSLPLGFTFSFPLTQEGLSRGILKTWTKGFDASGVVGENVVELLEQAIVRRGDVNIEVFAILNDTTGTLMSCAWKDNDTKIGVIVGTGCNACYVEKVENCEMFEGDKSKPEMIVNTEWGAFGDGGELKFIRTQYDCEVDKDSINPGRQLFEKMISGMYMGELARQIIVKFTKEKLLFCGKGSDTLFKKYAFETRYVSEIEADPAGVFDKCRSVLRNELGLCHASEQDAVNVRFICECVSRRAADLCSAGLATLIDKMPHYRTVTIGVDGSVYRYHPHFHNLMMAKIKLLCRPDCDFKLMLSQDGSGRGAALVAAVISKEGTRSLKNPVA